MHSYIIVNDKNRKLEFDPNHDHAPLRRMDGQQQKNTLKFYL